jgi:hypothetical protein
MLGFNVLVLCPEIDITPKLSFFYRQPSPVGKSLITLEQVDLLNLRTPLFLELW